jgi:hypothetical protein
VVSEKRDVVGTGQIVATGKIAAIAVVRSTAFGVSLETQAPDFLKKFGFVRKRKSFGSLDS